jgi:hypothetical protein
VSTETIDTTTAYSTTLTTLTKTALVIVTTAATYETTTTFTSTFQAVSTGNCANNDPNYNAVYFSNTLTNEEATDQCAQACANNSITPSFQGRYSRCLVPNYCFYFSIQNDDGTQFVCGMYLNSIESADDFSYYDDDWEDGLDCSGEEYEGIFTYPFILIPR